LGERCVRNAEVEGSTPFRSTFSSHFLVFNAAESTVAAPAFKAPRAAYIHVPFCRHRCGYCNFTLITGRDDLVADYLRAIESEMATLSVAHEIDTLYFGGGTPTHLTPAQFQQLANAVLLQHPLASGYEWTIEANPADLDAAMIELLADLGVTRLSLGGQSFRAEKLQLLERDHKPCDVREAVRLARSKNMQVALDLIFATPGETLDQWASDLEQAIELQPNHVSTYGLTFERGTTFGSRRDQGELVECDEEVQRDMYALAIDELTRAGFEQYEVSNFAQHGCRSRHNQVYWSGEGYFAYGPGAARYINGVRETNQRSTTTYIKRALKSESTVEDREQLDPEARARELLVFSLRRIEGVLRSHFHQRTGLRIDELVERPLRKYVDLLLLSDDGERIKLTREGLFISDAIWPEFL
jgi:oxygen-independent coproporphyrinogen-3 oxidase